MTAIAAFSDLYRGQDLWIVALAIQHGMKALTRNRRDFEGIPALDLLVL